MTGTSDINYAQIMFLDDVVQMHDPRSSVGPTKADAGSSEGRCFL